MFRALVLVLVAGLVAGLGGCGRSGFEQTPRHVANLPDVSLSGAETAVIQASIDTTDLVVDGEPSADFRIELLADGTEVALLDVGALHVPAEAVVAITGTRPLVIAAARAILVNGVLDAGGHGATPGPGTQPVRAASGTHVPEVCDHGGGGGGHATPGGTGGIGNGCDGSTTPIGGGAVLEGILVAGSSGGTGVSFGCGSPPGGGGGGALQLSAQLTVDVTGLVTAGGGGGTGGYECMNGDAGSGGGGGAGGTIVLDAADVRVSGSVLSLGGGGGAGGNGNTDNGPIGVGGNGDDAVDGPALGGAPPAPNAGRGGNGGASDPPTAGGTVNHNGGGGGGAAGRVIVIADRTKLAGTIAP